MEKTIINHEELLNIGFHLRGVEENDPYYKITFKTPFKFNISHLTGVLENGIFWLYGNNTKYNDINELKKIIDIVGGEIYEPIKF